MRPLLLSVLACAPIVLVAACDDSSSSGGQNGFTFDGGTFEGGATPPPPPPGPGVDGGDAGGGDAGDAGVEHGPLATCDAPQRLDTNAHVFLAAPLSVMSQGDKWAAMWIQNDGHWRSRAFDGAALRAEEDVSATGGNTASATQDGVGHGFFTYATGNTSAERRVYDFATWTWSAPDTYATSNLGFLSLAAIASGGALSTYNGSSAGVSASKWLPATPTWTATTVPGGSVALIALDADGNANGKAALAWLTSGNPTGYDLMVSTYDGATWSTPVAKNFPSAGGVLGNFKVRVLANGDAALVYNIGSSSVNMVRFSVANQTFGAEVPLDTGANITATRLPAFVVDDSDRMTVVWWRGGNAYSKRDVGAGFGAAQDLGAVANNGYHLSVDRATGNAAVVLYNSPGYSVQRISGTDATWGTPIATGLSLLNVGIDSDKMAITFDSRGRPTVIAEELDTQSNSYMLRYASCR